MRHRIVLVLSLLSLGPVHAGAPTLLAPDSEVREAQVAIRGHLERLDDGAGATLRLRVAADARPVMPGEPLPRLGTYLPHLPVEYVLHDVATGSTRRGPLRFSWSEHGPHYAAELILEDAAGPLLLGFAGDDERLTPFAGYRWSYALEAIPGPADDGAAGGAGGGGPEVVPASLRMNLVGSFDPQPTQNYSDIWGYESGGTFLAIIGADDGTSFVDVTDPANASEVAFIGGPNSTWRDMKTYGHYAYIVTEGGGGLQIVDLADPLAPVLVNTWSTTFSSAHNLYIDTAEGVAYIFGSNNGTRILDLATDPVNPVEIGSWTTRYVHDGYARGDRAYFSEINNGLQEVLDATNKADLQVLASWNTPQNAAHSCWVNDDSSLIVTADEISAGGFTNLYDISDLGNVQHLGSYQPTTTSSVHNPFFDDDDAKHVWLSHYAIGVQLIDSHRPSAPLLLGYYDTYPDGDSGFSGDWGAYPFDSRGYVYASDRAYGLHVVQYAPTGGTLSGVVREAGSGDPISGAEVIVLQTGQRAVTAADGVYAGYADAGPIRIRVSKFGYTSAVAAAGEMSVGGRVDRDAFLTLLPTGDIGGTVTSTDDGAPVAGARVLLRDTPFETVTVTDAAGAYLFQDVPVGPRIVAADKFGFDHASSRVVLAAGGSLTVDLALRPSIFTDDGETDEGWSFSDPEDTASITGNWFLGDPNGTGGGAVQPEDDHTENPGVQAFHTGPADVGMGIEATDVDFGFTTLTSPRLDASGLAELELSYWRWLSREAGTLDGGTLLTQVSSDDGNSWVTMELIDFEANSWNESRIDVGALVPLTDEVRIRFRADAGPNPAGDSVTEAAVDDISFREACDALAHPAFGDADGDDVTDGCDACPFDPLDDADGDGRCADDDNAPFMANPDQADADLDGVGDVADNCVLAANADQRDLDRDGSGDACDADLDGDGVDDALDDDDDDDGVLDGVDLCPAAPDPQQRDRDLDGQGDACDFDDGVVGGVRFADGVMQWEPEQGADAYNVYRALLGAAELLALAGCHGAGLTGRLVADRDLPEVGDGFAYLVSSVIGGVEGSLGTDSDGVERVVDESCP